MSSFRLFRFSSFSCFVFLAVFLFSAAVSQAGCPQNILQRAEHGDYNAQCYLGHLYLCGKGVDQDFEKARFWYQRVIEQNGADAKIVAYANFVLGVLYNTGKGGKQCYQTALECFKKAAEQGYTDAHINIGLMYAKGLGVKKDYHMALYWWQLAEQRKHPSAAGYVKEIKEKIALEG